MKIPLSATWAFFIHSQLYRFVKTHMYSQPCALISCLYQCRNESPGVLGKITINQVNDFQARLLVSVVGRKKIFKDCAGESAEQLPALTSGNWGAAQKKT